MRRQRRAHNYLDDDEYHPLNNGHQYQPLPSGALGNTDDFVPLEHMNRDRFENTIEAKVEDGDTLQALALRFHCTVADIKRLNKIDKDNEIHARKVVKIPVTVHSVLLGTLPVPVHKSGSNSPQHGKTEGNNIDTAQEPITHIMRNPLEDASKMLGEKLLVASVNAAGSGVGPNVGTQINGGINNTILNSRVATIHAYTDDPTPLEQTDANAPLLDDILCDDTTLHIRPIRGPSLSAINWSGSDCDMSWVCLFVVILALCFVIPLVYVIYLAEHPHHHHESSTKHSKM